MEGYDSAVDSALARAHAAHPSDWVEREDFERRLNEIKDLGVDLATACVEDIYLALACVSGKRAAIERLEASCLLPAREHVAKRFRDDALAEEVVQRLREKLLAPPDGAPRLLVYEGRGSLAAWIRVGVVRAAQDALRVAKREAPLKDDAAILDAEPEADVLRSKYGAVVSEALRDALRGLPRESRMILRVHYLDRVTIEGVAALLRVSRATAARRLLEARTAVVESIRSLLGAKLGVPPSEADSLIAALASRLDVSMRRELATISEV